MERLSEIRYYGRCAVPENWPDNVIMGINRLYYIHGGSGGYIENGRDHIFQKNMLYYFPYTSNFKVTSSHTDPIVHSYMDFELVPPILCSKICKINPNENRSVKAATDIFLSGAETIAVNGLTVGDFKNENELYSLCNAGAVYLAITAAKSASAIVVNDKIVIAVMEEMISKINKKLTVESLAAEQYITPDALIRRFKRTVGVTPYAYLKQLRLRTARYMLEEGNTLSETAAACGYSDSSALLHALKQKR